MDSTKEEIIKSLVKDELVRAKQKYGLFNSNHEAYAVTIEEVHEAESEMKLIMRNMENAWMSVRNDKSTISEFELARAHAMLLIEEAIRVAAMAQKAIDSEQSRTNGGGEVKK